MTKAFSTGNLTSTLSGLQQLQPEPRLGRGNMHYHKESNEHRIRIEFEGDGPLGIEFVEGAEGEIIVEDIQDGTASAEFPQLETELLLREIDGSGAAAQRILAAMRAIVSSWRADSAVVLVFARPQICAPAPPPRTTSGPPSLAGMVHIKDDGVGNLEYMSPIHEAHRKAETPRTGPSAQLRAPPPPPELSLAGLEPAAASASSRVQTKRERQLHEVRVPVRSEGRGLPGRLRRGWCVKYGGPLVHRSGGSAGLRSQAAATAASCDSLGAAAEPQRGLGQRTRICDVTLAVPGV